MNVTWVLESDNAGRDTPAILGQVSNQQSVIDTIIQYMDNHNIPYYIIDRKPFMTELDNPPVITTPVVFYGSITGQRLCDTYNWIPGVWDGIELSESKVGSRLGNYYLNNDRIICKTSEIPGVLSRIHGSEFFIKSDLDDKKLTGLVTTCTKFSDYVDGLRMSEAKEILDSNMLISTVKHIDYEYRLLIVDKKVVTGSEYKVGHQIKYSEGCPDSVLEFANKMIRIYNPYDVYIMDIGIVNNEPLVIEYNSFNSAGLYKCYINKAISSITDLIVRNDKE